MGLKEVIIGDWTPRQIKRHFNFDNNEIRDFHISVFLMSLIFFFFIWAFTDLNLTSAILTWVYCWIIVAGSLYLFIAAPKFSAITKGNLIKYKGWTNGLLIGFIVSFLSYGLVPLLTPGSLDIQPIKRLRHGKRFHYETRRDMWFILFWAPITSMLVALLAQWLFFLTKIQFIHYVALFNAIMAFFAMVPLTKNVGVILFYMNKKIYMPLTVSLLCFMLMIIFNSKYAFIAAILGAVIGYLIPKKIKSIEHIVY